MSFVATILTALGIIDKNTPLIVSALTKVGEAAAQISPAHADQINSAVIEVTTDADKLQHVSNITHTVVNGVVGASSHAALINIAISGLAFVPAAAPFIPVLRLIAASEPAAEALVTSILAALPAPTHVVSEGVVIPAPATSSSYDGGDN